ncbi:glycine oxidase ThiO [Rhizobium sp. L1K21]|uniref:glycine oxidase ThiO n=1 Tax=Rhizobium sp. L1K21 TaxID=2954933 RepID=UPI002092FF6F|nr:glycine oxidase ThiO [Rhizobium sp. L1K21]MCO6188544.1 glycine oxidase ThiO [Rhizobium sp. L1K21]
MRILIKGAGVTGLTAAYALARRGLQVEVSERCALPGPGASHCAGGMLAPWCEGETAPDRVVEAGKLSIDWWTDVLPHLVRRNGTLVVAPARDTQELERFANRTSHFKWLGEDEIARLEPALSGRFRRGLFFPGEAHLDPRSALAGLYEKLLEHGVTFHFNAPEHPEAGFSKVVDCTGKTAIRSGSGLRGVRGEMLHLRTPDIRLSRPVRLLHPRFPLYVVPQSNRRFMVGATMIESENEGAISARSLMELLNAAYALHPAFGEAEVLETASGIRPAYADNIPAAHGTGKHISINGMYRHGYLMAPALAEELAEWLVQSHHALEAAQ